MAKLPRFLASLLLLTSLGDAGASAVAGVPTLVTIHTIMCNARFCRYCCWRALMLKFSYATVDPSVAVALSAVNFPGAPAVA